MESEHVLIAGATGYVGGKLLPELEREGASIRCFARNPQKLAGRVGPASQVVQGDLLDARSVDQAMEGVRTAYFLVHLMAKGRDFHRQVALPFRIAEAIEDRVMPVPRTTSPDGTQR